MSDNIALDDDNHLETSDGKLIKFHTPAFLRWLEENKSFRFEAGNGGKNSYRARKETIKGVDYWYAVKKVNGKLHKRFIGKSSDVTHHRLIEVSKLIRQPAKSKVDSEHYQPTPNISQTSDNNEVTQRLTNLESLVSQLQQQVEELTKKLNDSGENAVISPELEDLQKQNERLQAENSRLTEQVGLLTNQLTNQVDNTVVNQVSQPHYITIRNRVLSQWKVAKRAETRERIALAIDKFIEELGKVDK